MFRSFGENFQLGIDCVASIGQGRQIVFGWHTTPRGLPVELRFATPDGRICRVEHISRHLRLDVIPEDPGAATVSGFSLVVATPFAARGLVLTVVAGEQSGSANLAEAANTDLFRANEERDWGATFDLLKECMERPDVLTLLDYQYRPFGAFAGWMTRLPLIHGHGENISVVARVSAGASPAGEVVLNLRFIGRPHGTVELDVLALARLRSADGGPDEIVLLPFVDASTRHAAATTTFYARLGWEHVARLQGLDLIVQIGFDAERIWLRCQPEAHTVPAFLDAVGATSTGQDGQSLLLEVIQRRTEVLMQLLQAEQGSAGKAAAATSLRLEHPELALVGVDDSNATRLLHVLAPELEACVSGVMLLGEAAEVAAQDFVRRGRIPATVAKQVGAIASRAEEIGAQNLVALDVSTLAVAVIEGRLPAILRGGQVGSLAHLLLLHIVAGPTALLGESLARHVSLTDNPDEAWVPVDLNWHTSRGEELINDHLEAMWRHVSAPHPKSASSKRALAAMELEA